MAGWDGKFWKVFDYAGKEITTPINEITAINYFADDHLFLRDNANLWAHLMIKDGEAMIMEDSFQLLQPLELGYAYARMDKTNLLYGKNGSWVQPDRGHQFKFWSSGLIGVKSPRREYYTNLAGQNVFDKSFNSINKFRNGLAVVRYKGKLGVINRKGLFIVPPKFDNIKQEKTGHISVELSDQLYGLRSSTGKEIIPAKYDSIEYLEDGVIKVEYADFVGYYRHDGTPLWTIGN